MGQKAHRSIMIHRGQPVGSAGGSVRVGIGGRGRSVMRDLRVKHRADMERARARQEGSFDPTAEHVAASREVHVTGQILKDRTREPFDFYKFVDKQGPYTPTAFHPKAFVAPVLSQRAVSAYPLAGWGIMAGLGVPAAFLLLDEWWRLLGVAAVLLLAGPMAVRQVRARPGYAARLQARLEQEHREAQTREAAAHVAVEEARRQARLREEELRVRLREGVGTRSPAALGDLAELQLLAQSFPLPLVLDLDFDGFEHASVDLLLPEIDDMPEEVTSITHSGRLVRKKMDRTDRAVLHDDACCALALRLAHELFRGLPMTQRVTLRGLVPIKDPAGREVERSGLAFEVSREDFMRLNLLTGAPAELVRQVGRWGGNRRGEIAAV